jgi:peptidyl-prolyl cis-trans isomerase C
MRKVAIVLTVLAVVAMLAGCCSRDSGKAGASGSAPKDGKVLATVGKTTITLQEMQDRLNRQNPYIKARFSDPAKRKEFLDTMVRGEVLYQKAIELGIDKDPEIMDRVKGEIIQKMIYREFDEKMKDSLVPADDIKKYYNEHLSDYNKAEAVWVKIIQAKDKAKAEAALKELKGKTEDQNAFVELVKKYSDDDKTNKAGGDITYKTRDEITQDYGKDLSDAAFKLDKIGDITAKPVASKGLYFVARLQGKRPAQNRTLDQVEGQIKNRLYYEKRNQAFEKWVNDMAAKSGVTRNDALLSELKIEGAAATPPQIPGMPGAMPKPGPGGAAPQQLPPQAVPQGK